MDLEKIIDLAKILAKPYKIVSYILGGLLVLSMIGNIYLSLQETEVSFDANNNLDSNINQSNE